MDGKYVNCSFDSRFITHPLGSILTGSPTWLLFHQLEALAVRFRRWYNSPEVVWSQEFDTQTGFLDELCRTEPKSLAVQLSEADLSVFRELAVDDLTKGSGHVLSGLNTRWNSLCCSVEECSTDGDSFDLQLVQLAQVNSRPSFD